MSQPTQPGQDVPDELLTAALGGYYGHPTAITAADPDVIDGLTAGLAAGMASFDQRLRDVQDEYARAGASWDTTRDRLNGEIARLTEERDAAREANGRYAAAGARWQQRAEQAETERDQLRYEHRLLAAARMTLDLVAGADAPRWDEIRDAAEDVAQRIVDEIGHSVTDEPALGPSFREEIERLRAAVKLAARHLDYLDLLITTMGKHNPTTSGIFAKTAGKIRAALDQAPAAEQDGGRQ